MIRIRGGTENRATLTGVREASFETVADHEMVAQIHEQAFGGTAEARLVEQIRYAALAPLAVLPGQQYAGVGTAASIVPGDPAYYARFGYRPAAPMAVTSPAGPAPITSKLYRPVGIGLTQSSG